MRTVMFVANSFLHDARVTREARTLVAAGHDVTVLAVRNDPSLPAYEEQYGFTVRRLEVTGKMYASARRAGADPAARRSPRWREIAVKAARTYNSWRFCVRAAKVAAAMRPDVYHCHDFDSLLAGVLAKRRYPARLIFESHELYAHLNVVRPLRLRAPAVHALERRFLRSVDAIVVVSESFADHLVGDYGVARPSIVRNIPDTSVRVDTEVPEAFSIPEPKLLYVGGIQRERGIEQTVRATALLDGVHLIVMGPGFPADEARVRALISDLGLNDRVHLVPPVPHESVTTVSSHASVGIVPFQGSSLSHRMTIPNKLFESLHAGLPVVASDFPEFRKIVEGYDCGRLCDTSDPSSIAAAVKEVLADRERLAANARAAARELTWERESAVLLGVYERLRA